MNVFNLEVKNSDQNKEFLIKRKIKLKRGTWYVSIAKRNDMARIHVSNYMESLIGIKRCQRKEFLLYQLYCLSCFHWTRYLEAIDEDADEFTPRDSHCLQ